jgi:apolipoprotein N-acyltransferase
MADVPNPTAKRFALLVFALTPLLAWLSFPAVNAPECALVFAVPALLWAARAPAWRLYGWTLAAAWTVAWVVLLFWLHHVTFVGLALLAAFLGGLTALWFLAARWALPRAAAAPAWTRVATMLGLAGLWVVGEWVRGWVVHRFPVAAAGGVAVAAAADARALSVHGGVRSVVSADPDEPRRDGVGLADGDGSLHGAAEVVHAGVHGGRGGAACGDVRAVGRLSAPAWATRALAERGDRAAVHSADAEVGPCGCAGQSAHPGVETAKVAAAQPDLVLWPESAVPYILKVQPELRGWFEAQAKRAGAPLLSGVVVMEDANLPTERWFNAAAAIDPERGLQPEYYAKRHLVPWGEYVPLHALFGWLRSSCRSATISSGGRARGRCCSRRAAGRWRLAC